MNINFHTYRTIKWALTHMLAVRRGSHQEQHITTLALFICGIVGSQHVQFAHVAQHMPIRGRKNESLIMRLRRWVHQHHVTYDACFLPFARALVQQLATDTLTVVLDGSTIGRGCVMLMVSVVYRQRALPLAWVVVKAQKGHLPEHLHCRLIQQLRLLIPDTTNVIVLGDGEFDGIQLQEALKTAKWHYVCRTGPNICITVHGSTFPIGAINIALNETIIVDEAAFTHERYGPVTIIAVWEEPHEKPIYLVTSLKDRYMAVERYRLRFCIETLFADQKSRGFQVQKSHLHDPERIGRLLIATSLSYLWVLGIGVFAQHNGWVERFHRKDRCDLSLFQCGLRALTYAQRERLRVPVCFVPQDTE